MSVPVPLSVDVMRGDDWLGAPIRARVGPSPSSPPVVLTNSSFVLEATEFKGAPVVFGELVGQDLANGLIGAPLLRRSVLAQLRAERPIDVRLIQLRPDGLRRTRLAWTLTIREAR